MEIIQKSINEIIPYENNPRKNEKAVESVKKSIRRFGFKNPIIVDSEGVIIAGHTRYKASLELGLETVPVIVADDLSPTLVKAYRLADNKTAELAEWDIPLLQFELDALKLDFDMSDFGFDMFPEPEISSYEEGGASGALQEKYIIPPFSVLDSRQGYWQERKTIWKGFIDSGEGRADNLLGNGIQTLCDKKGMSLTGTSIFDPVLCEIMINWFCPNGGRIIDPFAGGSVRGLVSVMLGNEYTGIDLSAEQIEANYRNYSLIASGGDLLGNPLNKPEWIIGDSMNIDILAEGEYDFLLTCPPYGDLEKYSDNPADLSNMGYEDFREAYSAIIRKSCDKLKDDAFACIVVGDIRDKNGYYRDFVGDTKKAFYDAGLKLYNDCVLLESLGTAPVRAGKQFNAKRKVVKTHQNVLIFIKGNEKRIMERLSEYEYDLIDDVS